MAIYRPRTRRWPAILSAGLLGLVVGLALGWGLRGPGEQDPAEALDALRNSLTSAAATLEVVEVEYGESVADGQIVSTPEYEGARSALEASRSRYLEAREGFGLIDPDGVREADRLYEELETAVARPAPAEDVSALIAELTAVLQVSS